MKDHYEEIREIREKSRRRPYGETRIKPQRLTCFAICASAVGLSLFSLISP